MEDGDARGARRHAGFFLEAPDEVPRPAPPLSNAPRKGIDLLDDLYEYRLAYGREPSSWRDLRYGVAHLSRASAREKLRIFAAVAHAGAIEKDQKRWLYETQHYAGF